MKHYKISAFQESPCQVLRKMCKTMDDVRKTKNNYGEKLNRNTAQYNLRGKKLYYEYLTKNNSQFEDRHPVIYPAPS